MLSILARENAREARKDLGLAFWVEILGGGRIVEKILFLKTHHIKPRKGKETTYCALREGEHTAKYTFLRQLLPDICYR